MIARTSCARPSSKDLGSLPPHGVARGIERGVPRTESSGARSSDTALRRQRARQSPCSREAAGSEGTDAGQSAGVQGDYFVVRVRTIVQCRRFAGAVYPLEIVRVAKSDKPAHFVERRERAATCS